MHKLIGSTRVKVEAACGGPAQCGDVENMGVEELVTFLRDRNINATANWKIETLRKKAHTFVKGAA